MGLGGGGVVLVALVVVVAMCLGKGRNVPPKKRMARAIRRAFPNGMPIFFHGPINRDVTISRIAAYGGDPYVVDSLVLICGNNVVHRTTGNRQQPHLLAD